MSTQIMNTYTERVHNGPYNYVSFYIFIKLFEDNFMLVFFSLFQPDLYTGRRRLLFKNNSFFSSTDNGKSNDNDETSSKRDTKPMVLRVYLRAALTHYCTAYKYKKAFACDRLFYIFILCT